MTQFLLLVSIVTSLMAGVALFTGSDPMLVLAIAGIPYLIASAASSIQQHLDTRELLKKLGSLPADERLSTVETDPMSILREPYPKPPSRFRTVVLSAIGLAVLFASGAVLLRWLS